jgi:serine/threonine protein kinase
MKTNNSIEIKWPNPGDTITTDSGMGYTIGTLLNDSGGFGLLYEGYDTFGNPVAIKIFKPSNRKFADVKNQWESETAILDLVRHPNVVFIHDSFICNNLFYIVFERAQGNLDNLVQQVGPLNELTVREIARQLLFALHYTHQQNILHKDLTVNNILYFVNFTTGQGLYKISDFGISEEFTDKWTSTNKIAHRLFKPPELIKFGYTTLQSDLYHLGLVLYFCLTGQFPYDLNLPQDEIDKAILDGIPRQRAEEIGTAFGEFISILLRRREEYRFRTELEAWANLQTK